MGTDGGLGRIYILSYSLSFSLFQSFHVEIAVERCNEPLLFPGFNPMNGLLRL